MFLYSIVHVTLSASCVETKWEMWKRNVFLMTYESIRSLSIDNLYLHI